MIDGLVDINSICRDLEVAGQLLTKVIEIDRQHQAQGTHLQDQDEAQIAQSLNLNAVMHYVRATHTSSDVRRTLQLRPKLTEDLWTRHRAVCGLRDGALAHYGHGAAPGERQWVQERLVIAFEPDGRFELKTPNVRANYLGWVLENLQMLIPVVQKIAEEDKDRKASALISELSNPTAEHLAILTRYDMSHADDIPSVEKTMWHPRAGA